MTALIYKAALPTYTSAEALAANADENLVLNDAGTAYELEPGGAFVPEGSGVGDVLYVYNDSGVVQNIAPGANVKITVLDTPRSSVIDETYGPQEVPQDGGTSFEFQPATNDFLMLRNCLVQVGGVISITPVAAPAVDVNRFRITTPSLNVYLKQTPRRNGWADWDVAGVRTKTNGFDRFVMNSIPVHAGDVIELWCRGVSSAGFTIPIDYAELYLANVGTIDAGATTR